MVLETSGGKRAVVILSGGLDSTTCMAVAKKHGYDIFALSFAYNQRHIREIECAVTVAEYYGANHKVLNFGSIFAASALTSSEIMPSIAGSSPQPIIPATYVPARNILFLAHALSYAEAVDARRIYIGVNVLDNPGYPDCRPEFISAFQQVIDVGTKSGTEGRGVQVKTPLIQMTKQEIIEVALELGAPLHLTHTCYFGEHPACGRCDSCRLRLEGFRAIGVKDPIPYRF